TAGATPELVAQADLIVAGAPLLGFALPTANMRKSIAEDRTHAANPPDMGHPSMREWMESVSLRAGARAAGFETRIWWSPGSSAKKIAKTLEAAGCSRAAEPEKFLVTDKYGPLKDGELERAKQWGAKLAATAG
ncbi:MAG: flavodoxin, partial [Coriobacteriia bacterium]|nr:flavodoxin [Coriobacteriia bacterium]